MCFIVRFIINQVVYWFWCSNISISNSHICSFYDIYYLLEKNFGSDLVSIDSSANSQLPNADIAIGEATKKALAQIKPDRRKSVYLGIHTFYSRSVTYLQSHLPLQNTLLKVLGCLNPVKREKASSVKAIARLAKKLQPQLDVSIVQDEWQVNAVDEDVEQLRKEKTIFGKKYSISSLLMGPILDMSLFQK